MGKSSDERRRQERIEDAHNKGQQDGSSGAGYKNPANTVYAGVCWDKGFKEEVHSAYLAGFDNGVENKPK